MDAPIETSRLGHLKLWSCMSSILKLMAFRRIKDGITRIESFHRTSNECKAKLFGRTVKHLSKVS